jgi:Flp pilus assembly protein TadB
MADFVTLSCPSCGGKLEITNDLDRFACGYCGKEQVVRRTGGVVSLAPVVEGLKQVQAGVDKTASELAIRRLREDIAELEKKKEEAGNSGPLPFLLGLAGLVGLGLGIWGIIGHQSNLCVWSVLLIVLIIGPLAWYMNKRAKPIDDELEKKRAELARHERLVSG